MSAHRLLPALLLLAAALFCPTRSSAANSPSHVTVVIKGDTSVPLGPQKPYMIQSAQCSADISQIKAQPELECPAPSTVVVVEVSVRDYLPPQAYIADDLNNATVTRLAPCTGNAEVMVRVGCGLPH